MRERPNRSHPAEGVLVFRDQPTIVFVTICSRKRRANLANDSVRNHAGSCSSVLRAQP